MKTFFARLKRCTCFRCALSLLSAGLSLLFFAIVGAHAAPIEIEDASAPAMDANHPTTALPRPMLPGPPDASSSAQPLIGQIIVLGNRTLSQTAIVLISGHK